MDDSEGPIDNYVEPMLGACGVMTHMGEFCDSWSIRQYGSDGCEELIMLWDEVLRGVFRHPTTNPIDKTCWMKLKHMEQPTAIKAYVGFGYSFSGIYFGAFTPTYKGNRLEQSLYKQASKFPNLKVRHCDYQSALDGVNGRSVIYCDPPYTEGTYKFGSSFAYEENKFQQQVLTWKAQGHMVFVSESELPFGEIVMELEKFCPNKTKTGQFYIDRLYKV